MRRRLGWHIALAASLLCLSCQSAPPGASLGQTLFALGQATPPATPVPAIAAATSAARSNGASVPTASPTPSPLPSPSPSPPRFSGGGWSAPAPTPTPTPLAAVAPLEPVTTQGTMGNPADALRITGIRFDKDFVTNGKLHLAFSVIVDGQDVTERVDPAQLKGALTFDVPDAPAAPAAPAPAPYRILGFETLEVAVEGLKAVGRPPLDAMIDIDSSGSMGGTDPNRLRVAAIQGYIDGMRPDDQVALMDFSSCETPTVTDPLAPFVISRLLYPFGKDRATAKAAVDQITACSNTPLYDSMLEGIAYLAAQNGNRPRALIALSDGQDNASQATIQDVIAAAKAADVLLMMLAFADYDEPALQGMVSGAEGYFVGAEDASTLEAQYSAAVRTVNGNAQAIIFVPADKRIANHMTGRLTATIDGQSYSGTFNAATP